MIELKRVLGRIANVLLWIVGLILAGILFALLGIALTEYNKTHWLPGRNWVVMGLFTVIMFTSLVVMFRPSWGMRFWLLTGILLILHSVAFATIFSVEQQRWSMGLLFLVTFGEGMVLESTLLKLGFVEGRSRRRRKRF